MKKFKILSREKILDAKYSPVEKHIVELPSGKTTEWYVNTTDSAVVVVPILSSGEVLLQRNYKHGSREVVTEFCAGLIDDGEKPIHAAERELLEETGYKGQLHFIGEVFANPTGSTMKYYFFVAEDCKKIAEQDLDEAEQVELFTASDLMETRKILTDPKTKTAAATVSALAFAEKCRKNI